MNINIEVSQLTALTNALRHNYQVLCFISGENDNRCFRYLLSRLLYSPFLVT